MRELFSEYGIIALVMIVMIICLIYFMKYFFGTDAIVGNLVSTSLSFLL
ncbi:MAG: hypothetical protein ACI4P1_04190 [Erysipelotrichaceae bacterium]|nr:hypothetical protein [Bacillota bacterium]